MVCLISVSGNPRLTHSHDPVANPSQPKQLSVCQSLAVVSNEAEKGHSLSISLHPQKNPLCCSLWGSWVRHTPRNRKGGWWWKRHLRSSLQPQPWPHLPAGPCSHVTSSKRPPVSSTLNSWPDKVLHPDNVSLRHTRTERFLFLCGSFSAYSPQNIRTGTLLFLALWSQNPEQCLAHT